MTQEEKDLLFKDLCARLPYGVKISVNDIIESLQGINVLDNVVESNSFLLSDIEEVKPYLFPLSSMTEEQRKELEELRFGYIHDEIFNNIEFVYHYDCMNLIDWCYKNNLDINGLIPRGLANDATGLNIYQL